MPDDPRHRITDPAALEALYGPVGDASRLKEIDHIHPAYAALIKASPFAVLATGGPGGMDASPRGDDGFVVDILDEKTLILPDRRGNNRIDSLRNILVDPRVALLFLIPGIGETLRVNGSAVISADPALLSRYAIDGKLPRTVMVIAVESAFFQCSRALIRADIWNPDKRVPRASLPSTGAILEAVTRAHVEAEGYDRDLPGRLAETLY